MLQQYTINNETVTKSESYAAVSI